MIGAATTRAPSPVGHRKRSASAWVMSTTPPVPCPSLPRARSRGRGAQRAGTLASGRRFVVLGKHRSTSPPPARNQDPIEAGRRSTRPPREAPAAPAPSRPETPTAAREAGGAVAVGRDCGPRPCQRPWARQNRREPGNSLAPRRFASVSCLPCSPPSKLTRHADGQREPRAWLFGRHGLSRRTLCAAAFGTRPAAPCASLR